MAMADSGKERRNENAKTSPAAYIVQIGFFAGLIGWSVRWTAAAMNFTRVPAAFLADPWVRRSALTSPQGQFAGFALFILMSIAAAFLYFALLKPFRGPVPGLVFGFVWWAALYWGIGPMIGAVPALNQIGANSWITDLCIFLVWGLFIGYSIAYEYHDESEREPQTAGG
jgi:hypothetical protein